MCLQICQSGTYMMFGMQLSVGLWIPFFLLLLLLLFKNLTKKRKGKYNQLDHAFLQLL